MQNTRPILAWETLIDLDSDVEGGPLRDRVESALRRAIDDGRVTPGAALPPSRTLAETLGVSRWVVTEAYGQLVAEGVLEARTGSATRVAENLGVLPPAHPAGARRPGHPGRTSTTGARDLTPAADTGIETRAATRAPARYDLRPGIPDLRAVPRARWSSALRSALTELPDRELAAAPTSGHSSARAAVASYLARSRQAVADHAHVTITHGATDAMDLLTRELYRHGHRAILVEDPSWSRLRVQAERNGLRPIPVPVDAEGIDTDRVVELAAQTGARAALVTPAHQFPLGAALSPARREHLVRWARTADALLIEDDYDAEFRYDRRPVPALQRLAPDRVALIGSLSKSVSPALGVGWMLLPSHLAPAPAAGPPSLVDQAALAHFLTRGDFERHLRSSRSRFRRRRQRLLDALDRELPGLDVSGIAAGMHLVLRLPSGCTATEVVSAAADLGIALTPLHRYAVAVTPPEALVLGYGNLDDALVEEAAARLALVLRSVRT